MCGIFGIYSYGHLIENISEIMETLAVASIGRGIDATGVAYINPENNKIDIIKHPIPAYGFDFSEIPADTKIVIGHVRAATHGSPHKNINNHPFLGKDGSFALAHNGIISSTEQTPKTEIETDSYKAVQLLEKYKNLKDVCERVIGSFTFEVLYSDQTLEIAKHISPVHIVHIKPLKLYIWASTKDIVDTIDIPKGSTVIPLKDGEILRINGPTTEITTFKKPPSRSVYDIYSMYDMIDDSEDILTRIEEIIFDRRMTDKDKVIRIKNMFYDLWEREYFKMI